MKARNFIELDIGLLENALSIHKDRDGNWFYNLLEKVRMPEQEPESYFDYYTVKDEDQWPNISYAVYGDVKLWWLVLLANKITNPLQQPVAGSKLKIYKRDIARTIIGQIQ